MESQKSSHSEDDIIVFPGQDYDHHDWRPGASVEDTTSRDSREGGAEAGARTAIIVVIVVVVSLLLACIVFFIYRSGNSEKSLLKAPFILNNNVLNARSCLFISEGL